MFDRFQGDPRLILTEEGAEIKWIGGQPVMDQGIENEILIPLFTEEGWVGNILFTDPNQRIGSNFIATSNKSITINQQNKLRQAALDALDAPILGEVDVEINNPSGYRQNVAILAKPPFREEKQLLLVKNGQNWINQKINPANERI